MEFPYIIRREEIEMKSLWNSFKIAFSMFSKIPMPRADWTKENMKYMFYFFPFIGSVIGAAVLAAAWLADRTALNPLFAYVILTVLPVLITGGIHVDGLLDTADALSSWQERSRRLEILKDSNAGAFAVITSGVYFLLWLGAWSELCFHMESLWIMALGFMVSRCFSGLGVIMLPKAREDGTVAEFSRKSEDIPVRNTLIVYLVLLCGGMLWIHPVVGAAALAAAVIIFAYYRHVAMKYFGGTTGDLSGWFLCLCEVGMALVTAVASAFWF